MKLSTFFATALLVVLPMRASFAAEELRVLVHSSFSLPKPLLAQFEAQSGVKLAIIKGGDAGEVLNKAILTKASPVADVVFGIDSLAVAKAIQANVLDGAPTPVDYGYVALNYDKAAFAKSGLALPKSMADLTQHQYRGQLVVQNPNTSSTGYAFLLATIAGMGEEPAFAWWAKMRANDVKVVKGWSNAYYTEFTRGGGTRPLVVSYASSPAAEVFYSKEKVTESPTGSLLLKGGVMRQVEVAGVLKGDKTEAKRAAAQQFIAFLTSPAVQEALQTTMWMYPIVPKTPRHEVLRHAVEPSAVDELAAELVLEKSSAWLTRWTQTVLK